MMREHLLTIIVFLPLVGALGLLLFPASAREAMRRFAFLTSVATFAVSLLLLAWFDASQAGMQFAYRQLWIQTPLLRIDYFVGLDGLSLVLVLLTTVLTPFAVLASWPITERVKEFFVVLLVLETGMLGVFVALDLILFYVFWEVMLIPMYFLIGVWGHERRLYAAIKFILYTMAGSLLMLVAILWLYSVSGTFDLWSLYQFRYENPAVFSAPAVEIPFLSLVFTREHLLFLAFFVAFAIKVPLFPFHTWLPDAHVEAPTAGSVILAGVLLKMGAYGLLRFCLPLFPDASRDFAPPIMALAVISILYGALVSLVQPDMKKLIAYSSVSHMGFVVLGIMAFNAVGIQGAIYLMLGHGLSTGVLFLIAGMLYDRRHTHLIREFGGLATPVPVLSTFFLIACLSSLGLPPLVNWVGEFLVLVGAFRAAMPYAVWAALGVVFAAVYMLWMYQRVVFGPVTQEANRRLPDASRRELAILVPLTALIIFMGLASPYFTRRLEPTTRRILLQLNPPHQELAERAHPPEKRR